LLLKRGKDKTVISEPTNFFKKKYQKYCESKFTTLRVTFVARFKRLSSMVNGQQPMANRQHHTHNQSSVLLWQ
jgi:hypothetical protein